MPVKLPRLSFCAVFVAVALSASQAWAVDAKKIADALVAAAAAENGATASYKSATATGDDVTVTDFKTAKNNESMTLPSLVFAGAALRPKGGFTATKLTVAPTSMSARGQNLAFESLSAENIVVPSAEEVKAKAHIAPFSRIDIGGLVVSGERFPVAVRIEKFGMSVESDAAANPTGFEMTIDKIEVPPTFFANNFLASAYLKMLGYNEGFNVSVAAAGTYENATDTLNLKNFTLDMSSVGKLTFAGKFSGVSLRKLGAMHIDEVQETGKLENFTLRFDNAGVVERLLDMQAKTQQIKREDAVGQATAALGFFMIAVPNTAFADKTVASITAFLNDPKSVTISFLPKEPVPFEKIFDTIGDEPENLPDVVGADVTSNN